MASQKAEIARNKAQFASYMAHIDTLLATMNFSDDEEENENAVGNTSSVPINKTHRKPLETKHGTVRPGANQHPSKEFHELPAPSSPTYMCDGSDQKKEDLEPGWEDAKIFKSVAHQPPASTSPTYVHGGRSQKKAELEPIWEKTNTIADVAGSASRSELRANVTPMPSEAYYSSVAGEAAEAASAWSLPPSPAGYSRRYSSAAQWSQIERELQMLNNEAASNSARMAGLAIPKPAPFPHLPPLPLSSLSSASRLTTSRREQDSIPKRHPNNNNDDSSDAADLPRPLPSRIQEHDGHPVSRSPGQAFANEAQMAAAGPNSPEEQQQSTQQEQADDDQSREYAAQPDLTEFIDSWDD